MMIYFHNDDSEGCHPKLLQRLADSNLAQTPGCGVEDSSRRAAARIRALCEV